MASSSNDHGNEGAIGLHTSHNFVPATESAELRKTKRKLGIYKLTQIKNGTKNCD